MLECFEQIVRMELHRLIVIKKKDTKEILYIFSNNLLHVCLKIFNYIRTKLVFIRSLRR